MKNLVKTPRASKMDMTMNLNSKLMAKAGVAAVLAGLFGSSSALAGDSCFPIDLKTGYIQAKEVPDNVDVVVDPVDSNGDGYYETVLKISLNNKGKQFDHHGGPSAAAFKVYYDADPTGLTVNIGDSETNDGGSGDAGTQSNDAELTVGGLQSGPIDDFDELRIFGHDGISEARGGAQLAQISNVTKQGETLALAVGNERVDYKNKTLPITGVTESSWLYALNGQPDSEGPVNNNIYASFNRVISGPGERLGAGAAKVEVCLVDDLPKINDRHLDNRKNDHKD